MEGLLPLIYKAIKGRRGRSLPRSLSAGAVHRFDDGGGSGGGGNGDGGQAEERRWLEAAPRPPASGGGEDEGFQHGRHRSLEELAGEVGLSPDRRVRLPKAGSVRILSCISAA